MQYRADIRGNLFKTEAQKKREKKEGKKREKGKKEGKKREKGKKRRKKTTKLRHRDESDGETTWS